MTGRAALGVALTLAGSLAGVALVVVLGLAIALLELVRLVWARRGLRDVTYARRLATHRAVTGDEVPLDVVVWNRKRLPLAWLRASDLASAGLAVRERELRAAEDFGLALVNAWSLAPYERVTRHFHVLARRRGVQSLGPVRLEVGDLFAGLADAVEVAGVERLVVRPRTLPVRGLDVRVRWGADRPARRGLMEQPPAYAGVREYQPGDPLRRLHARASARVGRPLTKRFDPAREREVMLALDVQTIDGPAWQAAFDDDLLETLCIVVASLARRSQVEGAAVGLAAAGYAGSARPVSVLRPSESRDQVPRVLDTLARLSPYPSTTFERLLGGLPRDLRPGAEVVLISGRDPRPWLPVARRLRAIGYGVGVVAVGPSGPAAAAAARAVGLPAAIARLDGPWAQATELLVA